MKVNGKGLPVVFRQRYYVVELRETLNKQVGSRCEDKKPPCPILLFVPRIIWLCLRAFVISEWCVRWKNDLEALSKERRV